MKKLLSGVLAAATVLSLSATSFAAVSTNRVVDKDGEKMDVVSGNYNFDAVSGVFDVVAPDQTVYAWLGDSDYSTVMSDFILLNGVKIPAAALGDKDCFRMQTKDKEGAGAKLVKVYQEDEKTIKEEYAKRSNWLEIVVADTKTTDELKGEMTLEFKVQKDLYEKLYKAAKATAAYGTYLSTAPLNIDMTSEKTFTDDMKEKIDGKKYTMDLKFWINNATEDGSDADVDAGDKFVFDPESNEENMIIWDTDNGERAALRFDADDDADKFYAKLSIKNNRSVYAEYGDPVGADLWFYDFTGSVMVPSTSRATLTLGIPWDEDATYTPSSPEDCFIYRLTDGGELIDVTDEFTYDEDGDIDGWYTRTRKLGTFVVSDMELDADGVSVKKPVSSVKVEKTPSKPAKSHGGIPIRRA